MTCKCGIDAVIIHGSFGFVCETCGNDIDDDDEDEETEKLVDAIEDVANELLE